MIGVKNLVCVCIYFLYVIQIPAYAEDLQCYVCTDCDEVNETHIESCIPPDDSVTETPEPEDTDTPDTDPPTTDGSYTDVTNIEPTTTDEPDLDVTITETTSDESNTDTTTTNAPNANATTTDEPNTDATITDIPNTESTTPDVPDIDVTITETTTNESNTDTTITDAPNATTTDEPNTDTTNTEPAITDGPDTDVTNTDVTPTDEPDTGATITDEVNTDTTTTEVTNTETTTTDEGNGPNTEGPATSDRRPKRHISVFESDAYDVEGLENINELKKIENLDNSRAKHISTSSKNLIRTLRDIKNGGTTGTRCVVTSFIENDKTKVVRGCSFEAGEDEHRCRAITGGFTGDLTRCLVCDENLCNSASTTGAVLITLIIALFINVYVF